MADDYFGNTQDPLLTGRLYGSASPTPESDLADEQFFKAIAEQTQRNRLNAPIYTPPPPPEQPGLFRRAAGAIGSVAGAQKHYLVDPAARALAEALGGHPSEGQTTGSMLREAVGLAPSADQGYLGALGGRGLEFATDVATDPLTWELWGLGGLVGKGAAASKVLGAAPEVIAELSPAALKAAQQAARVGNVASAVGKGAGAAFTGLMGAGAIEEGRHAAETVGREGFSPQAAEQILGTTLSGAGAFLAGSHLAGRNPFGGAKKAGPPPDQLLQQGLKSLIDKGLIDPAAAQEVLNKDMLSKMPIPPQAPPPGMTRAGRASATPTSPAEAPQPAAPLIPSKPTPTYVPEAGRGIVEQPMEAAPEAIPAQAAPTPVEATPSVVPEPQSAPAPATPDLYTALQALGYTDADILSFGKEPNGVAHMADIIQRGRPKGTAAPSTNFGGKAQEGPAPTAPQDLEAALKVSLATPRMPLEAPRSPVGALPEQVTTPTPTETPPASPTASEGPIPTSAETPPLRGLDAAVAHVKAKQVGEPVTRADLQALEGISKSKRTTAGATPIFKQLQEMGLVEHTEGKGYTVARPIEPAARMDVETSLRSERMRQATERAVGLGGGKSIVSYHTAEAPVPALADPVTGFHTAAGDALQRVYDVIKSIRGQGPTFRGYTVSPEHEGVFHNGDVRNNPHYHFLDAEKDAPIFGRSEAELAAEYAGATALHESLHDTYSHGDEAAFQKALQDLQNSTRYNAEYKAAVQDLASKITPEVLEAFRASRDVFRQHIADVEAQRGPGRVGVARGDIRGVGASGIEAGRGNEPARGPTVSEASRSGGLLGGGDLSAGGGRGVPIPEGGVANLAGGGTSRAQEGVTGTGPETSRVGQEEAKGPSRFEEASRVTPPVQEWDEPRKKDWLDKVLQYQKAAYVSAPPSHVANVASTGAESSFRVIETALSGAVDKYILREGPRSRFSGEAVEQIKGNLSKIPEGLGVMADGFRHIVDKEKGLFDKVTNLPLNALGIEDAGTSVMNAGGELRRIAYREAVKQGGSTTEIQARQRQLMGSPTKEMEAEILKNVDEAQFRAEFTPEGILKMGGAMRQKYRWLQLFVPFYRTPANIGRLALQRSPAGFVKAGKAYNAYKAALKAGAPEAEVVRLKGEAADALARPIVGSTLIGAFTAYAASGGMTGSGPTDLRKKALLKETGWQPYSFVVRFGGDTHYIPFNRFEPVSSLLGFAADLSEIPGQKKQGDLLDKTLSSVMENLSSKTYLRGLADAAQFVSDYKRFGSSYVASLLGGVVPNIAVKAAQAIDPYERETAPTKQGFAGVGQKIGNRLLARIPGATTLLPVRTEPTGGPQERPGNALSRFLSPIQISTMRKDVAARVAAELERVDFNMDNPSSYIAVAGRRVELTPAQQKALAQAQLTAVNHMNRLIQDPTYQSLPDSPEDALPGQKTKQYLLKRILDNYRKPVIEPIRAMAIRNAYAGAQP